MVYGCECAGTAVSSKTTAAAIPFSKFLIKLLALIKYVLLKGEYSDPADRNKLAVTAYFNSSARNSSSQKCSAWL